MHITGRIAGLALAVALLGWGAAADPAKRLFGAETRPSEGPPAPVGEHARGCLAGAAELPETGPAWQAMRLSRNRNWGHPEAVDFIRRLGREAQALGWPGIAVGDISQPRGGPMLTGHRSHQIGLDIDVWMRPPPSLSMSRADRERIGSVSVVAPGGREVGPAWTPGHGRVLRAAAEDPSVARIFVHAAIKRRLCRDAPADDRAWLARIRPWWGHDAHFHVRLACPGGATGCLDQDPVPAGDGCDASLDWWFSEEARNPKPSTAPRRETTLADLPAACAALVGR